MYHEDMLSSPRRRIALIAVAVLALLGAASQLLVPRLARDRLSQRLSARLGPVESLSVGATPAIKLLWGDADRIDAHLGTVARDGLRGGGGAKALRRVEALNLDVDRFDSRLGTATGVAVRKRDGRISAAATVAPGGGRLRLAAAPDGALTATAGPLRFAVVAQDGQLVATPADGSGPLTSLMGARTLLAPDGVAIEDVRATAAGDGVRLQISARAA